MKQEFFPLVSNNDVTHRLKRCQIPTSVSVNGTKIQEEISGMLAILEPRLVTSFINVLKPILV